MFTLYRNGKYWDEYLYLEVAIADAEVILSRAAEYTICVIRDNDDKEVWQKDNIR